MLSTSVSMLYSITEVRAHHQSKCDVTEKIQGRDQPNCSKYIHTNENIEILYKLGISSCYAMYSTNQLVNLHELIAKCSFLNGQNKTSNNKQMVHVIDLHPSCLSLLSCCVFLQYSWEKIFLPHPSVLLAPAAKRLSLLSSHEANGQARRIQFLYLVLIGGIKED